MNIQAQNTLTEAETALIESFSRRASVLPGNAEVTVRRDAALEALKAGLPTRRSEAWHYTDLRRLLKSVPAFRAVAEAAPVPRLVDGATVFPVLDGSAQPVSATIDGLSIGTVGEALMAGALMSLSEKPDRLDAVTAINTAFVSDGYTLAIAPDTVIENPIELQNIHSGGQAHSCFRLEAGAGSKAVVVERQTGTGEALVSSLSDVTLGDNADLMWILVQEQPDTATHLGRFSARIGRNARLTLFIMNAGGALVRQEVHVQAAGESAEFKLRGVNLLAGTTHCDVTMVLDHLAEKTYSTETLRNVVTDKANGVFQGQIRVARDAQKTDAKMACNTLLLSDEGGFSAKPELEIFADDVACGHGATVTEIDAGHLFYLMARGIGEKAARGLLVKAFLAEVIEELENEAVVEALETRLDDWFASHG